VAWDEEYVMGNSEGVARDEFFESLLGDFLDESGQLLDRLNENLLRLDEWVQSLGDDHGQRCDDELMNDMFRSAHSLKGLSAMLGLKDINHLTHKVENVFDAARKSQLTINGDVVELMFHAVDRLVSLVGGLKDEDSPPTECQSVIDRIAQVLQQCGAERGVTSQADAERALAAATEEVQAQTAPPPATPETQTPSPAAVPAPVETVLPDPMEGIDDESEISSRYLGIFIDETDMALDQLTETLLAMEGGDDRAKIERLLVTSHRIKGSAASIGLRRAAKLAHHMEDLLQNIFDRHLSLRPETADALLKCSDGLRQQVQSLRSGVKSGDQFGQLVRELQLVQAASTPSQQPVQAATPATRPAPTATPTASPAAAKAAPAEPPASYPAKVDDHLRAIVAMSAPEGETTLVGTVVFQPKLSLVGLKARLIHDKLANLGEVCYFDPPLENLDEVENLPSVSFGITTDEPIEAVHRQVRVAGVRHVLLEPIAVAVVAKAPVASKSATTTEIAEIAEIPEAAEPTVAAAPAAIPAAEQASSAAGAKNRRAADNASKPTETLRVDIERLDQLMNLAGQLVISKARFSQIGDRLRSAMVSKQSLQTLDNVFGTLERMTGEQSSTGRIDLECELQYLRGCARRIQTDLERFRHEVQAMAQTRGSINNLFEAIHQLDRVADGIQQNVMDTRMVPIGPLFTRFKRVVRDITRSNGKQVNLVINGEKTELDKRMIDELGDPLIHMVRNSADHGIESPEVRESQGKPREGTIRLDAFHRGNSIVIQVIDDGKGLDSDRILRKAVEKGLVSQADAEKLTRQQIYQYIWEPGLSTADKVTEVSGRGMGMDIVKSKIEDIHGTVELDSAPGQGTTITIKLPLTLAILPSLMVQIDRDVFAMSLESVVEIVRVRREELSTVHGRTVAHVRGRVISVLRLCDLFRGTPRAESDIAVGDEATLVVLGGEGREIGLAVDRVIGEEDVVIKSMAENYRNVPGIAGASILGDGRVSLILDVAALIDVACTRLAATVSGETIR
jgi:two-component system chemotaxis sensor kinase CheA